MEKNILSVLESELKSAYLTRNFSLLFSLLIKSSRCLFYIIEMSIYMKSDFKGNVCLKKSTGYNQAYRNNYQLT